MIQEARRFFASLPDTGKAAVIAATVTFIGTLLAALAALIGIVVTHRGHEKRFARQLLHDREQKKTEREMVLRKEVYLEASEAIASALAALGRHADLAVLQDDLARQFAGMQGAIAKVHLIGGHPTLNALSAFSVELTSAVLELSLGRAPLLQKHALIKVLEDRVRGFGEERDRMVQLMKELNYAGSQESHRWQFVQDTFQFEQERVNKHLAEQAELRTQCNREWLAFAQLCYKTVARMSRFVVPAIAAVRKELDLPFDADEYGHVVESALERQNQILEAFVHDVQAQEG